MYLVAEAGRPRKDTPIRTSVESIINGNISAFQAPLKDFALLQLTSYSYLSRSSSELVQPGALWNQVWSIDVAFGGSAIFEES